jgi:hypothetical protein
MFLGTRAQRGRESEAGFELAGIDQETNSLRGMGPATGIESLVHDENRRGATSGKRMRVKSTAFMRDSQEKIRGIGRELDSLQ